MAIISVNFVRPHLCLLKEGDQVFNQQDLRYLIICVFLFEMLPYKALYSILRESANSFLRLGKSRGGGGGGGGGAGGNYHFKRSIYCTFSIDSYAMLQLSSISINNFTASLLYAIILLVLLIISPDESRGYIGFRSVAPPPPPP